MRLLPLLTALLIMVGLYVFVMRRDAVLTALGVETAPATVVTEEITPLPVSVVVLRSHARDVETRVLLRGETEAEREVAVQAETSGLVVSEPLRKGIFVAKDTVLCELDSGTRLAELDEAKARLAEARINDRAASNLRERGFGSENQAISTKAAVQSAEAAVKRAETEIDRLQIRAPFSGSLESDSAEIGSLLQPGSVCATIIELDPIRIVGYLPEADVHRVRLGARAGIRLVGGMDVAGNVTFIARSADPQTRTFRVDIEVPNSDLAIRAGQTAEIAIEADGERAHVLPGSALTLNDDGHLGVRTVDASNIVQFQPIRILRDTSDGILVAGLPDSADVIVTGQEYVIAGEPVRVTYRESGT